MGSIAEAVPDGVQLSRELHLQQGRRRTPHLYGPDIQPFGQTHDLTSSVISGRQDPVRVTV